MTMKELRDVIKDAPEEAVVILGDKYINSVQVNGAGCSPFTFGDIELFLGESWV